MSYDDKLVARINQVLGGGPIDQKKMFGGICYLHQGNMLCGVYKDFLILRLGVETAEAALEKPGVRVFDITGRPMKGWVMVAPEAAEDNDILADWIHQARNFVETLPPK